MAEISKWNDNPTQFSAWKSSSFQGPNRPQKVPQVLQDKQMLKEGRENESTRGQDKKNLTYINPLIWTLITSKLQLTSASSF